MKKIKKLILGLLLLLAVVIAGAYALGYGYVLRAVRVTYFTGHKTAFLEDAAYFDNRTIKNGTPQPWNIARDYNQVKATSRLEQTHKDLKTVAFMIITNDSIWHESYYDIGSATSATNSFSMAKSIVTSALGKAISLGYIASLDTKVIDFLPELIGPHAREVTVGDLASMSSGQLWDENYYGPTSVTTQAYFKKDVRQLILSLPIVAAPGQKFIYQSGDTQLLAMVLEKATKMHLADFVSQYFWQPMGMEHEATWQIDHAPDGVEKAFCCVASNARDFARFGKLYLQNGQWNNEQLLPESFVQKSIHARFDDAPEYGYGWWLSNYKNEELYYMRGHLGQFVIVLPHKNTIIVRLGHLKGEQTKTDPHSNDLYVYVDEVLTMLKERKQ